MTTAICAWLHRRGVRVAPFKAQNMSNNSYPCEGGGEIGRAQVAQALACGLDPDPSMNPILLKPTSLGASQVILHGKLWKTLSARDYYEHFDFLLGVVLDAYADLASRYEVVVIEGAGSITELNLRRYDLVNLGLATRVSAPCLLVADIERGGVFASVVGTFNLLTNEERSLTRAFAINKFRGDISLFDDGRRMLEEKTGCPCLGVFPFAADIHIDDEDSLSLPQTGVRDRACAILRLPRISNTTDFRLMSGASWIDAPVAGKFDFIVLPGTKSTIDDLAWLRAQGLDRWILDQHERGATIIGICGGFQMLGATISDPDGVESTAGTVHGLGMLPVTTVLRGEKTTQVVSAQTLRGHAFSAYEIHVGETSIPVGARPFAQLGNGKVDGCCVDRVIGTYLHGALEDIGVLEELGIPAARETGEQDNYARLADFFALHGDRFEELFL